METADGSTHGRRELRSDAHRNRERLAQVAVGTLQGEGPGVPMATIADDAGVGVGTLYRHFATREELLDELTHRSFRRMLELVLEADEVSSSAGRALRHFLAAVIRDRDALLLPTTGGPAVQTDRTRAVQRELHRAIEHVLSRGAGDGTIVREVEVWDVAWLGATLAQPARSGRSWDVIGLRLLDTYLAGLTVPDAD